MFSRIITIFFSGVRFGLLYRTVRRKYDDDIRKSLQYVNNKCYIGDWFVLYQARKNSNKMYSFNLMNIFQLAKNCNPYFYREFIRELAR